MHYRVYKLNPGGKIASGDWIEAQDEQHARAQAEAFCDEATPVIELWQGARRLAVLPCRDDEVA